MTLFTNKQFEQLMQNGHPTNLEKDHKPVVKLVLPGTGLVFLITGINNEQPGLAFGLCDLGTGYPELGCVDIGELSGLRTGDGYKVVCDPDFEATHPLSVYAGAAHHYGAITTDADELEAQGSFFFSRQDHP